MSHRSRFVSGLTVKLRCALISSSTSHPGAVLLRKKKIPFCHAWVNYCQSVCHGRKTSGSLRVTHTVILRTGDKKTSPVKIRITLRGKRHLDERTSFQRVSFVCYTAHEGDLKLDIPPLFCFHMSPTLISIKICINLPAIVSTPGAGIASRYFSSAIRSNRDENAIHL